MIALKLGNPPVHAQEEIDLVHIFLDLRVDLLRDDEFLVIPRVDRGQQRHFVGSAFQHLAGVGETTVSSSRLGLLCHIFLTAGTARAFPEMRMCQAAHDRTDDQFRVHCSFFHNCSS